MKKIDRSEVLPLGEYEKIREPFRKRIVEMKKARRIKIGDDLSLVFENHDTMLMQVQEMLRTERISNEKGIAHELETYNELVPGDRELSATLFIEIPELARREEMLTRLCAIEEHVALEVDGERSRATFEEGRRDKGRAAAVQYLKFPLGEKAIAALREGKKATLVLDHAQLNTRVDLPPATIASLADDLSDV
jgi:hypothetical protein